MKSTNSKLGNFWLRELNQSNKIRSTCSSCAAHPACQVKQIYTAYRWYTYCSFPKKIRQWENVHQRAKRVIKQAFTKHISQKLEQSSARWRLSFCREYVRRQMLYPFFFFLSFRLTYRWELPPQRLSSWLERAMETSKGEEESNKAAALAPTTPLHILVFVTNSLFSRR